MPFVKPTELLVSIKHVEFKESSHYFLKLDLKNQFTFFDSQRTEVSPVTSVPNFQRYLFHFPFVPEEIRGTIFTSPKKALTTTATLLITTCKFGVSVDESLAFQSFGMSTIELQSIFPKLLNGKVIQQTISVNSLLPIEKGEIADSNTTLPAIGKIVIIMALTTVQERDKIILKLQKSSSSNEIQFNIKENQSIVNNENLERSWANVILARMMGGTVQSNPFGVKTHLIRMLSFFLFFFLKFFFFIFVLIYFLSFSALPNS